VRHYRKQTVDVGDPHQAEQVNGGVRLHLPWLGLEVRRRHLSPHGLVPAKKFSASTWRRLRCQFLECDIVSAIARNIMATNSIKLLTGNSYPELARLVADRYVHFSPRDGLSGHDLACTSAHYQASTPFSTATSDPALRHTMHTLFLCQSNSRQMPANPQSNSITNGCTDSE
jgi:hypothetical protein